MTFPGRGKPVAMGGVGRELPWQVTWRDGAVAIGKLPPMGAVDMAVPWSCCQAEATVLLCDVGTEDGRQLPWSLVSYSTFIEASPHWSTMCLRRSELAQRVGTVQELPCCCDSSLVSSKHDQVQKFR